MLGNGTFTRGGSAATVPSPGQLGWQASQRAGGCGGAVTLAGLRALDRVAARHAASAGIRSSLDAVDSAAPA